MVTLALSCCWWIINNFQAFSPKIDLSFYQSDVRILEILNKLCLISYLVLPIITPAGWWQKRTIRGQSPIIYLCSKRATLLYYNSSWSLCDVTFADPPQSPCFTYTYTETVEYSGEVTRYRREQASISRWIYEIYQQF